MIHMFKERSEEWLAFRKKYISATEAPSIVGLNSYLSANQLIAEKSEVGSKKLDNHHMRDGRGAEAMSFVLLEEMGWKLDKLAPKGHTLVFTDDKLGLSSTPDNFRWDIPAVVEVKKVAGYDRFGNKANYFLKNWSGDCPPLRYLTQIQVQMHTTGFDLGYLACTLFEDDAPIAVYKVKYSKEFIDILGEGLNKYRKAVRGKRYLIKDDFKEQAAELLKQSYEFEGVHRFE